MSKPVILVTGASGLIGQALVESLKGAYTVWALDCRKASEQYPEVHYHQCDLGNTDQVRAFFTSLEGPVHRVINLAAYYNFLNEPSSHYGRLLRGLGALAEGFAERRAPDGRFIQVGSMACLQPRDSEPLDQNEPSHPRWRYPKFKCESEQLLRDTLTEETLTELVLAGVYTDYGELVPLYQFIEMHRSLGLRRWFYPGPMDVGLTYVHLEDAVAAIEGCVRLSFIPKGRYLVGESSPTTYEHIAHACDMAFYGRPLPHVRVPSFIAKWGSAMLCLVRQREFYRPWMIDFASEHYRLDTSATRSDLEWSPAHKLSQDLVKILAVAKSEAALWTSRNEARPWHPDDWSFLPEGDSITIYFDGACYVCAYEIGFYRRLNQAGRIHFVDISAADFDAESEGLDPKEVNRLFHVRDRDGAILTGVDAFIEIWQVIPVLRPLGLLARFKGIRFLLELGYALFVRIRPYLPRKSCETDACSL